MWLSLRAPSLARLAFARASKQAEQSPEKFSRTFDKELSPPDLQVHRDPVMRQAMRDAVRDCARHGPAGFVEEDRILARPSGIPFEEIDSPVRLWHGDADAIVPMHHAEYVAGRLRNAELTVMPWVGHLHTAERWRQIVTSTRS